MVLGIFHLSSAIKIRNKAKGFDTTSEIPNKRTKLSNNMKNMLLMLLCLYCQVKKT